jgi:hypothetical protein
MRTTTRQSHDAASGARQCPPHDVEALKNGVLQATALRCRQPRPRHVAKVEWNYVRDRAFQGCGGKLCVPKMASTIATNRAQYWRDRAEEVRLLGEGMTHAEARRQLTTLAAGYERMAEHAERGRHAGNTNLPTRDDV